MRFLTAIIAIIPPTIRKAIVPTREVIVIVIIWHMIVAIITAATMFTVTEFFPKPNHKAMIPKTPARRE